MGALRDELCELLGPEGLAALAANRGGRRVRIPKRIPPGHWLAGLLGREAADLLASRYGGCRLYVPRGRAAADRRRCILELRRQGRSVAEIARATGLSDRRVWQVLAATRAAESVREAE